MKKTFLRGICLAALAMAAFASTSFAAPPDPSWRSTQAQQFGLVEGSSFNLTNGSSGELTPQVGNPFHSPAVMERMFWVVPQQLPTPWLKALAPPVGDLSQLAGITKMSTHAVALKPVDDLNPVSTIRFTLSATRDLDPLFMGPIAKSGIDLGGSGGTLNSSTALVDNGGGSKWMRYSWRTPGFAST